MTVPRSLNWEPIEELVQQITPYYLVIENPVNIGQYKSLDILYPCINTKWIVLLRG